MDRPRRWKPWPQLIVCLLAGSFCVAYGLRYDSIPGFIGAGLLGAGALLTAWQFIDVWRSG